MNTSNFMQEEDLMYTILADLKRTVREYVTAATEANCPVVRQMFTDLTNSTLRMQGDLYNLMQKQNMYSLSSPALRQSVEQAYQQNQQMQQKSQQFVQQKLGQSNQGQHAAHPSSYNQNQSAGQDQRYNTSGGHSYM
ncbi:spore coat protein [Paenibacillus marinisediminis]